MEDLERLIAHAREATKAELEAFAFIRNEAKNLVLLPVTVNGEQRFAITLARRDGTGIYTLILGYLALDSDKLKTVGGVCKPMLSDKEFATYSC